MTNEWLVGKNDFLNKRMSSVCGFKWFVNEGMSWVCGLR